MCIIKFTDVCNSYSNKICTFIFLIIDNVKTLYLIFFQWWGNKKVEKIIVQINAVFKSKDVLYSIKLNNSQSAKS